MGWLFGQNPNNKNLNSAVRVYVEAYLKMRNAANGNVNTTTINSTLNRAIKIFIDKKRRKVATNTTRAALSLGVSSNAALNAGAAAGAAATPSATPGSVASAATQPLPVNTPQAVVNEVGNAAARQTRRNSLLRQAGTPNVTIGTILVNGVNRKYNVSTGQFVNQNVRPYYSVKKDFLGRRRVTVNAAKFRNWARNQSIHTLQQLPNSVKGQIRNLQTIIKTKRAALQTQRNSLVARINNNSLQSHRPVEN
jgi:hypothetical protein